MIQISNAHLEIVFSMFVLLLVICLLFFFSLLKRKEVRE